MSQKVLVNCQTGESTQVELPPDEAMHLAKVAATWRQEQANRATEHAQREAIIGKLADSVGVSADELKRALGVAAALPTNTDKGNAGADK